MDVNRAINLINDGITYRPGYTVEASDNTHRYGHGVKVGIWCMTRDTGTLEHPDMWKQGFPVKVDKPGARAEFTITVDDCHDEFDVLRKVAELIIRVETHEMREFLRLKGTGEAPFHPHTSTGIARWGTPEIDMTYGLA